MFRSLDLNLGQSEITEDFQKQNSEVGKELWGPHEDHILKGSQKEQDRGCWMIWVSLEKIFSPLPSFLLLSSLLLGVGKVHRSFTGKKKRQWGYSMAPNAAEEVLWLYKELVASILAEIPCCQDQGPAHKKGVTAWKWLIMGGSDDTRF